MYHGAPFPFLRMHGCGNSFLVLRECEPLPWHGLAPRLLDRGFGLGGDGLMVLRPSATHDFEVAMFNPDGSAMGMCGNGIRCATRFLVLEEMIPPHTASVRFEVEGRTVVCTLFEEGRQVQVDMGPASFDAAQLPVRANQPLIQHPLRVALPGGESYEASITCVSMGNPHCVIFVEDVAAVPLEILGPVIERDPLFPRRTNVEFVERVSSTQISVRVWERGAGPTLACGTGACASVAAGLRSGLIERSCSVVLPGGVLEIVCEADYSRVLLTGPVEEVCRGTFFTNYLTSALEFITEE